MKMAVMGPVWPCRVYTQAPSSALITFRVWSVLPVISLRSWSVRQLEIVKPLIIFPLTLMRTMT